MRIREILNEVKVELDGRPKPVDAEKANQGYSGGVYFKTEADFNNVIRDFRLIRDFSVITDFRGIRDFRVIRHFKVIKHFSVVRDF